ncbi:MAG: aspartate carbamoyltransferase regulatory subunit [Bacteroidales bacterium]|jgi:aspartate carbamoyltransferase regulatory subunit|nr:aspartate carbamoyltransferase regulatory subunit [Bacteroidales bacterium]
MSKKELNVSALQNGTVIDHIAQGQVERVLYILNLSNYDDQIYLGANLDSKKYGKKGIIKVANKFFEPEEINKIALVSPTASIIEIRNYEVAKKENVQITDEIKGFVKCVNPNCITNHENVPTWFDVTNKKEIVLKCRYCEKNTTKTNIEFI